jgi:hypothetical protein
MFPQPLTNPDGIVVKWLSDTSRLCKDSIWQTIGRKFEEDRDNLDREIWITDELVGGWHTTPFHRHGFG